MPGQENNHDGRSPHSSMHVVIGLRDVFDQVQMLISRQASLDGKVDLALSTQSLRNDIIVRDLSAVVAKQAELEKIVEGIQSRPVVTPKAVWTAVAAVTGAIGVATAVISLVTR
jgi:hypothetical protein